MTGLLATVAVDDCAANVVRLHRSMKFSNRIADSAAARADESGVMNSSPSSTAHATRNSGRAALRTAFSFFTGFLAVSAATLVTIIMLRENPDLVTETVWIRCTLVLSSSIVTLIFMIGALRGSRVAFNRARLVSAIILIAVCVIVAIPGFLPTWVWIEQVLCGLLLLPAVIALNLPNARAQFPKQA